MGRRTLVAVLALGAVLSAPGAAHTAELRGDVLVTAARLFDGRAWHEPGAVLLRGGRVVAAGSALDATAGRTIALGNATICRA
jgi:hypothetical protein